MNLKTITAIPTAPISRVIGWPPVSASGREHGRVVITGASSGIGAALARELAPHATRIVLVARREQALEQLAGELRRDHGDGLEVVVRPCALDDRDARRGLVWELADQGCDLLVSNAGFGEHTRFSEQDFSDVARMVEVNVLATMELTRAVLPGMLERRRGRILVVGSGAGIWPMPRSAAYCTTKAAVHGFCDALRLDLKGTGVTITEVLPGPVETEFDAVAGADEGLGLSGMRIDASRCARDSVAGLVRGDELVFPGARYRALMGLTGLLPRPVTRAAASRQPS